MVGNFFNFCSILIKIESCVLFTFLVLMLFLDSIMKQKWHDLTSKADFTIINKHLVIFECVFSVFVRTR